MKELTNKQKEVLDCITWFIEDNGYSPTVRELREMMGVNSTATVFAHLKNLKNKGYITYVPKTNRTIRVIEVE